MKYSRKNVFCRLREVLNIPKGIMIYNAMIIIGITGISTISPYLYKILIDDIMIAGNLRILYWIIMAMIITYCAKVILSALYTYMDKKFLNLTSIETKQQLMKRFLYRDIGDLGEIDIGEQNINLEEDSKIVYAFMSNCIVRDITSIIIVIVYLLLMLLINPWLTAVSVVLIPATIVFSKVAGKKFNRINKELFKLVSNSNTFLFETIRQWREIKLNNLEEKFVATYDNMLELQRKINYKWILNFALRRSFYLLKDEFVMKVLLYFIGGLFILYRRMSVGELMMFMNYLEILSETLETLMQSNSEFIAQKATFERLFKILNVEKKEKMKVCPLNPTITFNEVDYAYAIQKNNVFTKINCEFIFGKKYLIIGESGIGKSTLIKLLLGINKSDNGKICINDIPMEQIDSRSYLKRIGVVMQEPSFFNMSIRENFKLIIPNAEDKEIDKAIKIACLDEFVNSLPEKLETIIGERGIKLSGGQKQRLAIARLILQRPQIIVLDEATNALDSVVERKIISNLFEEFKEKTFIFISHKPLMNYRYDYTIKIGKNEIVSVAIL